MYSGGSFYSTDSKIDRILQSLGRSTFRAKFCLSEQDRKYIDDKGIETIRKHAFDFIKSRIAPRFPKNDGRQTPMKNHPVFVAQHATATCCRGCIEKWHGIRKGNILTEKEINYLVAVIMGWVEKKAASL